jgi:hypothetical protein
MGLDVTITSNQALKPTGVATSSVPLCKDVVKD